MQYAALIGDMVGSRHIKNRQAAQKQLKQILSNLNADRDQLALVSPFTVTLGDEFQALLSNTQNIWKAIWAIEAALYPVKLRYAIGLGEIHTQIDPDKAIGMDGPAFHLAREAMSELKTSGNSFSIKGELSCKDVVDPALALLSLHCDKWRGNRIQVFAGRLAGTRIDALSKSLSISEQAVYQNINDGALETCEALLQGLSTQMDRALAAKVEKTS